MMIATCPHCRNGFYISAEFAGKVVHCSRCSKSVRAPDRRAGAESPPINDGIPLAIVDETKSEMEERLKVGVAATAELQKKLAAETKARTEIETRLQAQLEARSKTEGASCPGAKGDIEEEIKAEIAARVKAEVQLEMEIKAREELEEKLKAKENAHTQIEEKLRAEIETRSKAQMQAEREREAREDLEAKLKAQIQARVEAEQKLQPETEARAEMENRLAEQLHAKVELEEHLVAETQARAKAELQTRVETQARLRLQSQLGAEAEAKANVEKDVAAAQLEINNLSENLKAKRPMDVYKGLRRISCLASLGGGALAGLLAYRNGYILNSHFDRPVLLPFASKPVYLPINLIAIAIAGVAAVWVLYFVMRFIMKGFSQARMPRVIKERRADPAFTGSSESSDVHDFISSRQGWRSS
jgi:predicted Zn finger-like uncharacterized protein